MDLSVVIPCYNESEVAPALVAALNKTFQPTDLLVQLVFVDDGSTDGTAELLRKLVAVMENTHIRADVIEFSRNFGKEAALFAGLHAAEGTICGIMDGDLQQRPDTLLEMYTALVSSDTYDMVAAYQEVRNEGILKGFLKKNFYRIFAHAAHNDVIPEASDFRVFRRTVLEAVLSLTERDRFSKGIFAWVGFPTLPWPYVADERAAGTTKWNMRSLFSYALCGILNFTVAPLRAASVLGLISCLLAFLYAIWVVIEKYVFLSTPSGYATLICVILGMGGINLLFLGIIGEYLARAYMQGKQRPVYIIRKTTHTTPSTTKPSSPSQ